MAERANPGDATSPTRPFRDQDALEILSVIGSAMRRQGFSVSDAKPGKACDAAATCAINGFEARLI